jgi:hypothetical protein
LGCFGQNWLLDTNWRWRSGSSGVSWMRERFGGMKMFFRGAWRILGVPGVQWHPQWGQRHSKMA